MVRLHIHMIPPKITLRDIQPDNQLLSRISKIPKQSKLVKEIKRDFIFKEQKNIYYFI